MDEDVEEAERNRFPSSGGFVGGHGDGDEEVDGGDGFLAGGFSGGQSEWRRSMGEEEGVLGLERGSCTLKEKRGGRRMERRSDVELQGALFA
jgi:hypothetical protein